MKITINMEVVNGYVQEMEVYENGSRCEWIAKDIDEPCYIVPIMTDLTNELKTY